MISDKIGRRTLLVLVAVAAITGGCASPQGWCETAAFDWNSESSSQGTSLTIRRVRSKIMSGVEYVEFELECRGFPTDMPALLWMREGNGYRWATATISDGGDVDVIGAEYLMVSRFLRGQPLEVALESGGKHAFARGIPCPIRTTSEGRTLDIEMIDGAGTVFAVIARGFEPGEELLFTSSHDDKSASQAVVADGEGRAKQHFAFPVGLAGAAVATVAGTSATLSVEHYFGEYVRTGIARPN